jgi:rhodanese-related sulfurtransferase
VIYSLRRKRIMNRMFVLALAFAFALSMVSLTLATAPPAWRGTVVKEWVDAARAEVKMVTPAEVKAVAIDKKPNVIILDVRDPDEYQAGHIPGAINVSRGKLEFTIWDIITDRDATIYVYCLRGPRATLATKALNEMGYRNAVLSGIHFEPWKAAGYPVVIP